MHIFLKYADENVRYKYLKTLEYFREQLEMQQQTSQIVHLV